MRDYLLHTSGKLKESNLSQMENERERERERGLTDGSKYKENKR